nr:hypothetical protein [Geminicoccaceae bacterium]
MHKYLRIALIVCFSALPAVAQETAPGDACTGGEQNQTRLVGGPETSGVNHLLVCDGSEWISKTMWSANGKVGIGVDDDSQDPQFYVWKSLNAATVNWQDVGAFDINLWGNSNSYVGVTAVAANVNIEATGSGGKEGYGFMADLSTANDASVQSVYGLFSALETHVNDSGFGLYLTDENASTGGTQYGVYIKLDDTNVTRYGIYQETDNNNYFAGNVGVGTSNPQSALHIPDGRYVQFQDNNAGAPPSGDCDNNNERGRMSIDTTNNRLYI